MAVATSQQLNTNVSGLVSTQKSAELVHSLKAGKISKVTPRGISQGRSCLGGIFARGSPEEAQPLMVNLQALAFMLSYRLRQRLPTLMQMSRECYTSRRRPGMYDSKRVLGTWKEATPTVEQR